MNNTRFATAIHILTLLAHYPNEWINSDWIASSININPVQVRKELIALQESGFVISRKGKEGGSKLNKESKNIKLSDIYLAVKNSDILGKKNLHPNPKCEIGNTINSKLDDLFATTERNIIQELSTQTLDQFEQQFI